LVDKSLVRDASNIYSKSCPKGPTFTAELAWGAISGTVPGDRTDDRKAAGHGPGGGSTITSNRDCRCASRRTAGFFGRFAVSTDPRGTIHAVAPEGDVADKHERRCTPSPRNGVQRTSTGMRTLLRQRSDQFSAPWMKVEPSLGARAPSARGCRSQRQQTGVRQVPARRRTPGDRQVRPELRSSPMGSQSP